MSLEEIPVIVELVDDVVPGQTVIWPPTTARTHTALTMPIDVRVMRSGSRRKCTSCARRRVVYWLEASSGWQGASPQLCSICSGLLVHGGRHHDEA